MAEFLYLFRGVEDMVSQASPTEMQQHMNKWRAWMEELAAKGHLLGGQPLDVTGKVVYNSGETVTNGPFAEGPEMISGYLIINAASIEAAVELSKACPVFEMDGNIEVRPIQKM
jgi:hypothetical protein